MRSTRIPLATGPPETAAEFTAWRHRLGISQTQAAALLGTNKFQVCRIEANRAHVTPIMSILCWLLEDPDILERVTYYVGLRPTIVARPHANTRRRS